MIFTNNDGERNLISKNVLASLSHEIGHMLDMKDEFGGPTFMNSFITDKFSFDWSDDMKIQARKFLNGDEGKCLKN